VIVTDIFSDKNIENVIDLNRQIVANRDEPFGLDDSQAFYNIFRRVNGFGSESDHKLRIVKKSATLLSGIVWKQPFKNGNKATASAITKYFLQKNGYFFPLSTDNDEREYFKLLERTVEKFEGDATIYSEIEEYLLGKVIRI